MSAETFILFEAAPGLLLLRVKEWDSIAQDTDAVQEACADAQRFKQLVSCEAFYPFADAAEALETLVGVASGTVPPCMQKFLELHMPAAARQGSSGKSKKKQLAGVGEEVTACALGVCDPTLGKALSNLGYSVVYSPAMLEMHRGVRMHMKALAKPLKSLPLNKFQVGLGHSYSRHLMQLDPRMQDKPIMQSVALIDSLDKTINSFSMKLKEWYGWHFPELVKIVSDTEAYAKTLLVVKQKEEFDEEVGLRNSCRRRGCTQAHIQLLSICIESKRTMRTSMPYAGQQQLLLLLLLRYISVQTQLLRLFACLYSIPMVCRRSTNAPFIVVLLIFRIYRRAERRCLKL